MIFNGDKLAKLRKNKNLSMEEIAKRTGVPQSSLSQMETGKTKNPRPANVEKLSKGLGVSDIYFYVSGENLAEFFPAKMDVETRDFVLEEENLPYILHALKLKKHSVDIKTADKILMEIQNTC